ncbi:hypothetical protein IWZ01DRAFT_494916 [Phyllosticta capitalensis]
MLELLLAMDVHADRISISDGHAQQINPAKELHLATLPYPNSEWAISKGRDNRLSLVSRSSVFSDQSSPLHVERIRSPPPSYDRVPRLGNRASIAESSPPNYPHSEHSGSEPNSPTDISPRTWKDVRFVSKQFLLENLPDWISNSNNTDKIEPKDRSTRFKAAVKRSKNGLLFRLVRPTSGAHEIAEIRLESAKVRPRPIVSTQTEHAKPVEEPALSSPELDGKPIPVNQIPGLHEAPQENAVFELPVSMTASGGTPVVGNTSAPAPETPRPERLATVPLEMPREVLDRRPSGDSLLETVTFGNDEAVAWSAPNIGAPETDASPPSSIVPTPTRGLSVRGPVRHFVREQLPEKRNRALDLNAQDPLPSLDVEKINERLISARAEGRPESPDDDQGSQTRISPLVRSPVAVSPRNQITGVIGKRAVVEHLGTYSNMAVDRGHNGGQDKDDRASRKVPILGDKISPSREQLNGDFQPLNDPRSPQSNGSPSRLIHDTKASDRVGEKVLNESSERNLQNGRRDSNLQGVPKLTLTTEWSNGGSSGARNLPESSDFEETALAAHDDRERDYVSLSSRPLETNENSAFIQDSATAEQTPEVSMPNSWLPSSFEIRQRPKQIHPLQALFSHAARAAFSQSLRVLTGIYSHYGPESPVPDGHVRVRWTCSCGAHLHDDFIENREGAARELEAYLNRVPHSRPSTSSSPSSATSPNGSQIFSRAASFGNLTPDSAHSAPSPYGSFPPWKSSPTALRSNNPFTIGVPQLPTTRWLLACAEEGQLVTKLTHVDVTETLVRSDKDFAMELRRMYSYVNRRWWRLFRLRGLTSIEFVRFEVHRNRFVDIRKCPDMPPTNRGYDFEPHDLTPPVGSQYLMHLFLHPEDYDSEFIAYARMPKKRNTQLDVGVGWGIHLVEGFLADRVWMLITTLFGFASCVFAFVWSFVKEDVQGAFGVAAWMLALATMLVSWALAAFG